MESRHPKGQGTGQFYKVYFVLGDIAELAGRLGGPQHGFLGKGQIEFHIFIASGNRKKGLLKELLFFSQKRVSR